MKKYYITNYIFLGLLVISISLLGMEKNDIQLTELNFSPPLTTIKKLTEQMVLLVSDKNNKLFVLKFQWNSMRAIIDALGAKIGKNNVNMNQIQIFPSNYFTNKLNDSKNLVEQTVYPYISTVHTYMPGEILLENSPIHRAINNSNQLTKIAVQKELAPMVALNIFVNNIDCSKNNLLFNLKTKTYGLIDMDFSFPVFCNQYEKERLTQTTLKFLQENNTSLIANTEYLDALNDVNKTLGELIKEYPPQKLSNLFIAISQRVNKSYNENELKQFLTEFETYYNETQVVHNKINNLIKCYILNTLKSSTNNIKRFKKDFLNNHAHNIE